MSDDIHARTHSNVVTYNKQTSSDINMCVYRHWREYIPSIHVSVPIKSLPLTNQERYFFKKAHAYPYKHTLKNLHVHVHICLPPTLQRVFRLQHKYGKVYRKRQISLPSWNTYVLRKMKTWTCALHDSTCRSSAGSGQRCRVINGFRIHTLLPEPKQCQCLNSLTGVVMWPTFRRTRDWVAWLV